jgi:hypothetical protein
VLAFKVNHSELEGSETVRISGKGCDGTRRRAGVKGGQIGGPIPPFQAGNVGAKNVKAADPLGPSRVRHTSMKGLKSRR